MWSQSKVCKQWVFILHAHTQNAAEHTESKLRKYEIWNAAQEECYLMPEPRWAWQLQTVILLAS